MAARCRAHSLPRENNFQIVMIGRNGVGKSATGNTILRRDAFQSELSSRKPYLSLLSTRPVTQVCQTEEGELDDQKLRVVDTPGLFGDNNSVVDEIKSSLLQDSRVPVVFLVVLQLGRFTEEEEQTVKMIQKAFGKEKAHYTMALFTHGDALQTDGRSIEELIERNTSLSDLIRKCRGGYHVFNNKDREDPTQVTELLQKITNMVLRNAESNQRSRRQEKEDILLCVALFTVAAAALAAVILAK